MQAHHVFPKKFRTQFHELGINIDDPRFGSWWETGAHQKNSYSYGKIWDEFLENNHSPEEIFQKARELSNKYGFILNF